MDKVTTEYYVTESGRSPVEEFIDSLQPDSQRKFFRTRGLLENFGKKLPQPHAKHVGDGIFELRFRGTEGTIRVIYFFYRGKRAIFTNGFIKKTNKLPKREFTLAKNRRKDFLSQEKGKNK